MGIPIVLVILKNKERGEMLRAVQGRLNQIRRTFNLGASSNLYPQRKKAFSGPCGLAGANQLCRAPLRHSGTVNIRAAIVPFSKAFMNFSATFNVLRLFQNPSLCLPQATISNFNHLPIPVSTAFVSRHGGKVDIRAVILDKDNCFAKPKENAVHKPYEVSHPILSMEPVFSIVDFSFGDTSYSTYISISI